MSGIAIEKSRRITDSGADARCYELQPPLKFHPDWDKPETVETKYVVVSAVVAPFSGPETYIFSSDEDGEVTDWFELAGSARGTLDHAAVLRDAGYLIVA